MDRAIEIGAQIACVVALVGFVTFLVRHKWRQVKRDYGFERLLDDPSQDPDALLSAWQGLSPWMRDARPWLDPRLTAADRADVRLLADEVTRRTGGNTHSGALAADAAVRAFRNHGIPVADSVRRRRIAARIEEASDIFGPDVTGYADSFPASAEYVSRKVAEDDAAERGD